MARVAFDAKRKEGQDKNYFKGDFTTPEMLAIDLIALVPILSDDVVLDAGSGEHKVWYENIPSTRKKEVEIKDGKDFLTFSEQVDWVIGNPPFWQFIPFVLHSSEIARKGFGFLTNHSRINQLTPRRLEKLKEKGFYLSVIHILCVKKWFGRYYFIVFTRTPAQGISWSTKNY